MLTWMDKFVVMLGQAANPNGVLHPIKAAQLVVKRMIQTVQEYDSNPGGNPMVDDIHAKTMSTYGLCLGPFLMGATGYNPLAIQVDTDAIRPYIDHTKSDLDSVPFLDQHRPLYIDIPRGSLDANGGSVWVRAVFVLNHKDLPGKYTAFVFMVGKGQDDMDASLAAINYPYVYGQDIEGITDGRSADLHKVFADSIAKLVQATISYYQESDWTQKFLPIYSEANIKTHNAKKRRQQMKEYSLFRVVKLEPKLVPVIETPVEPVEAEHEGRGGWKLEYQVEVQGFWRNQRYGPGRQLTRRQFIPAFIRGPKDAPKKQDLFQIRQYEERLDGLPVEADR